MLPIQVINLARFETGDCAISETDPEYAEELTRYQGALDSVASLKSWTELRRYVRLRADDETLGVTEGVCPVEYIYPIPSDYDRALRVYNKNCRKAAYRVIDCQLRTPEDDIILGYMVLPSSIIDFEPSEKFGRLTSLYLAQIRALTINKSIAHYGKTRSLFKAMLENVAGNDEMQEPAQECFQTQYLVGKYTCGVCCGIPSTELPCTLAAEDIIVDDFVLDVVTPYQHIEEIVVTGFNPGADLTATMITVVDVSHASHNPPVPAAVVKTGPTTFQLVLDVVAPPAYINVQYSITITEFEGCETELTARIYLRTSGSGFW